MQHHQLLVFFALLIFVFGLFSRLAERISLTGPMFFMTMGILASPLVLGIVSATPEADAVRLLGELTLTLVLFIDASLLDKSVLFSSAFRIPARLLLIGLPLTVLFGTGLGLFMFDSIGIWGIVTLALILAVTDQTPSPAVMNNKDVPHLIRQSLSTESGLNDGLALPPILICLALLGREIGNNEGAWIEFALGKLTLAPLVGLAVGWTGGRLIQFMSHRGWMEPAFQRLSALPIAILAYAGAESVGGNGLVASFTAGLGLTMGAILPEVRHRIQEFGHTEGKQLVLVMFLIFGFAIIPVAAQYWGIKELIYALASLTLIRMIPVAISLLGAKLDWRSIAFLAWFGPRGTTSLLYLLIAIGSVGVAGNEQFMSIAVLTITISVLTHGISASPLSRWYGKRTSIK